MLINNLKKIYWSNRNTYRLSQNLVYGNGIFFRLKSALQMFFCTFLIPYYKKVTDYEIKKVKENNNIFILPDKGTKFFLPDLDLKNGQLIQNKIFLERDYFELRDLEKIKKYVRGHVLDIGANIGNHTLYFIRECRAEFVSAFEPIEGTYNILKKNIVINKLQEYTKLYNCACGSKHGTGSVKVWDPLDAGSTAIEQTSGGGVKIISLDELNLPKVDFIKIDVEGFELEVLKGMKKVIADSSPTLYIEIFERNISAASRLLENYGYSLVMSSGNNYLFERN